MLRDMAAWTSPMSRAVPGLRMRAAAKTRNSRLKPAVMLPPGTRTKSVMRLKAGDTSGLKSIPKTARKVIRQSSRRVNRCRGIVFIGFISSLFIKKTGYLFSAERHTRSQPIPPERCSPGKPADLWYFFSKQRAAVRRKAGAFPLAAPKSAGTEAVPGIWPGTHGKTALGCQARNTVGIQL